MFTLVFCAKNKMPHKICNNIFLHPAKKEILYRTQVNVWVLHTSAFP